ncbi:MAG: DUF445 family protein [Pyrinomonadaceae bacterium]|nr:DUF445 family protein [Pyrinomonadaceae bacterium]
MEQITTFFEQVWVQLLLMVLFAAFHGYGAAWLAVRMLFRPRKPVRLLGIPIFPQGMIPRHRERLANAIGKAVGSELVSQETVLEQLFEREFLRNKIQGVVDSYTEEVLSQNYPSIIEALPENLREAVLESVESIQEKLGEYVEKTIKSEDTHEAIQGFVESQVDEFLGQTVSDLFTDETHSKILEFIETRAGTVVNEPQLEEKIREFIGKRVDDLANTETPLGDMFTDEAISLLKAKAVEQIEPIVHQLAELATEDRTKNQISSLIKKEVHNYYEQLPFIKKIFVSRDNLLREVDDLVDDSLPKRIEETLQGDFFAEEAEQFVSKTIDNTLERPLPDLIGTIEPDKLDHLKNQLTKSVMSVLKSPEMQKSISAFLTDSLEKIRPQRVGAILRSLHRDAADEVKKSLSQGLEKVLNNADTYKIIHSVLAKQIDSLLHAPIGRLSNHIAEDKLRKAGSAMTETIISTARVKLPEAIKEFDIGGVVRDKVNSYPAEKLESLVLSIAKEHLRTIEFFGFLFGLIIGLGQAAFTYWAILNKIVE